MKIASVGCMPALILLCCLLLNPLLALERGQLTSVQSKPLLVHGPGTEVIDRCLQALSRGQWQPLEQLDPLLLLAPLGRQDQTGLIRHWTYFLEQQLAKLAPGSAGQLPALHQRWFRFLRKHGVPVVQAAAYCQTASAAQQSLQAHSNRLFDYGHFQAFLRSSQSLGTASDQRHQWAQEQLGGQLDQQPGPLQRMPRKPSLVPSLKRWQQVRQQLQRLDQWGRVRWAFPLPSHHNCHWQGDYVVIRHGALITCLDQDGNSLSHQVPLHIKVLGIRDGTVYLHHHRQVYRLHIASGQQSPIQLHEVPLCPPLRAGDRSAWLGPQHLSVYQGEQLIYQVSHLLDLKPQDQVQLQWYQQRMLLSHQNHHYHFPAINTQQASYQQLLAVGAYKTALQRHRAGLAAPPAVLAAILIGQLGHTHDSDWLSYLASLTNSQQIRVAFAAYLAKDPAAFGLLQSLLASQTPILPEQDLLTWRTPSPNGWTTSQSFAMNTDCLANILAQAEHQTRAIPKLALGPGQAPPAHLKASQTDRRLGLQALQPGQAFSHMGDSWQCAWQRADLSMKLSVQRNDHIYWQRSYPIDPLQPGVACYQDGDTLLFSLGRATLHLIQLTTGQEIQVLNLADITAPLQSARVFADGLVFLTPLGVQNQALIVTYPREGSALSVTRHKLSSPVRSFVALGQGFALLHQQHIRYWPVPTGAAQDILVPRPFDSESAHLGRDGLWTPSQFWPWIQE